MSAPVTITVSALGSMRCELRRDDRGNWLAVLWKLGKKNFLGNRKHTIAVFVTDHEQRGPRFYDEDFSLALDGTHITLPKVSWKKLKAWHEQVTTHAKIGGAA